MKINVILKKGLKSGNEGILVFDYLFYLFFKIKKW